VRLIETPEGFIETPEKFIRDGREIPLVLCSPEGPDSGPELLNLAPILRPIPRPLRGDRPVVVRLSLLKQIADRA